MATATAKKMGNVNLSEMKDGDVFSEQSHYVYNGKKDFTPNGTTYQFLHTESGDVVNLSEKYVENLLQTADQYDLEVEVGIEDKKWTKKQLEEHWSKGNDVDHSLREGDVRQKGILSIWDDIHSQQVFTVNFNKANKELSTKAYNEAKVKQAEEALKKIQDAQKNKKGVANVASQVIADLQNNPILPLTKGDERTLRGYKTQFSSINGVYDVVDMDIRDSSPKRQVNVRAINYLAIGGIKYTVK